MNNTNFHKNCKLNGASFNSVEAMLNFSKTISPGVYAFLLDWFDDTDTVNVQTSGSTGTPKNIALKKEYMINSALATGIFFDLPKDTTALLCLPANYIAGKMMLVRALTLGWQLDVVEASSNPLQGITKTYDFSAMVPMQVHHSLKELRNIKKLIVGGGVVNNMLINKLQSQSTAIYATYGMTESITHIAVKKLNGYGLRVSDSEAYKVLPDVKITTDSRGCLVIEASKIAEATVVTNDLVEIISDTEFIWLGRADTIINSGGIKLIPEQIERKLSESIHERFFVTGIPDEVLGEKLILIVESRSDSTSKEVEKQLLKLEALQKFEIPKATYIVKQFVETETKKIQRQKTLDLLFNK